MKWNEKKKIIVNKYSDMCELLNSPAKDFYSGSFYFVNYVDFANKVKADLLYYVEEFERVMKASFNSSLLLDNVDVKAFKKMYPNFANGIFNINESSDFKRIGEMLNIIRGINAHSIPSLYDIKFFASLDLNWCNLKGQKVFNKDITYISNNGELSLAGLIFIILNLGREQSIESLTKKNNVFGLISKGKMETDDGSLFVNEISHVDLTNPIREASSDNVVSSIFGDLLRKITPNFNAYNFELLRGSDIYQYKIKTIVGNDRVYVEKGSLTNVYYENGFDLRIDDVNHFIELSNLFPPFIFVDLLYKLGITNFDTDTYKYITDSNRWDRFSKLRYPKFYIDKNIDILLADEKHADIRINSTVCNGALVAILLRLEKLLIKYSNIRVGDFNYSKIAQLLKMVGCLDSICEKTRKVRNLASHCAIIGEYCVTTNGAYQYTFENIVDLLNDLLDFFKMSNQVEIFDALSKDISNIFIGQIVSIRTKLFSRETIKLLQSYPNITNLSDLKIKRKFYDNSSYDLNVFDRLNRITYGKPRLITFSIKEINFDLVLYINEDNLKAFDEFINRNGFTIVKDQTEGLFRNIVLS